MGRSTVGATPMQRLWVIVALLPVAASCGAGSAPRPAAKMRSSNSLRQVGLALQTARGDSDQSAGGQTAANEPTASRRIIYRATMQLFVKSFDDTDRKIKLLTSDLGGYVSQFSEDRSYGAQRGGR